MTDCPDLAAFEAGALSLELAAHVGGCASCQFVVELIEDRTADGGDDCSRYEALLAARNDGTLGRAAGRLLDRHLARCASCRAVADTLAPTADAAGDLLALPEVDPQSYELGLEVARGGMGRILAARDLRVGRPVAVKELLGRSPALAARFEREARVTARLQHPGIVPIYEIGRWPDGTPFYSMRMVDGRTLRQAIDPARTLGERLRLLPALIAATDAVAFAHGKRIIHRDLTPSNILVGAYGETVVIDWGLAKDLREREEEEEEEDGDGDGDGDGEENGHGHGHGHGEKTGTRLTGLGSVIGTAAYMPPEQAHAVAVDERADVYALGAILYHLLAGEPPYRETGTDRVLAAVRTGPPPPIQQRAPGVPRDLVSIVDKAMARDHARRYPSARELSEELRRWSEGRLVAAHVYTTRERIRRFVGRNRAALVVLTAAALVLSVGGWISVDNILDSRAHSDRTARTLLEERGRTEVLAGHPLKALAYLGSAHDPDQRAPATDFLLASALRELDDLEATLDCGDDVQFTALSPDGVYLAAACVDGGRIWRLDDHRLVARLGPAPAGFYWLAYSSDGRTLGTIGKDGVARLYDTPSGALRLSLEHKAGAQLNRISFSPDGARVVTSGADGKAVVWDARTGARLRTIAAGALGFASVYGLLAPDGRTLLTATMGGVGTGWDIETGLVLGRVEHGGQIRGADLSRDGKLAATCGADRRVRVWDLATLTARLTLAGHSDLVWKCVFSPDGRELLTTSNDGTAKVWDLTTGALLTSVDAGDLVWWGEFSPDGHAFVTASLDHQAKVWDARTGALLTSHAFAGLAAHFTRDGRRLVMERAGGTIQIWRRPTGRQRHELAPPDGSEVVDVTRDGGRAVVARGGLLALWDVAGGRPIEHAAIREPYALSADGRRIAGRTDGGVAVIDTASGATVAAIARPAAESLGLDRRGERLLVTDGEGAPQVIDVAGGGQLAALTDATDALLADDGRRALAWRAGAPPVLWTLDGTRPPLPLADLDGAPAPVGFSADGARIALHTGAGATRTLVIRATDDGQSIAAVRVAGDGARFDPAGTLVTAIGADGLVHVIRVADGRTVASFAVERLTSAQSDASGALVVASDEHDGVVSVLDAVDGRALTRWPVLHAPVITTEQEFTLGRTATWWTPDGSAIVSRASDVTVWDATTLPPDSGERVARARRALPWRVVDGQLRAVTAAIEGQVTHLGLPVDDAWVTVSYRVVPRLGNQVSPSTISSQPRKVAASTGMFGHYRLPTVPAGDFTLLARSARLGCASIEVRRTMAEIDQAIDLELTECDNAPPSP